MNPNAEPDDAELEAIVETAAEDALDSAFEPGADTAIGSDSSTIQDASGSAESESVAAHSAEPDESTPSIEPGPAPKLERLQKILAQAGVASRRHAEELIAAGRVQVNGQVVITPGSKADAARDHIRVDGKLIHSTERLRYLMLNKPKGFVTTVSDPEGRPTVMQFFAKSHERLYPVGRLDYQSEGLLLVTNDGDLANRLTRAASGVEKTYLVKVSGRPTPAELDALRHGVAIDRGRPGTSRVETAPARVREVRKGDNPWFEVVLIEGRNRELRKMFQEIGHFVEKIRRVGYGPLVLDIEPGKTRELNADEIAALRRAADGKLAPRRAGGESRQSGDDTGRRERGGEYRRDHRGERKRNGGDERGKEQRPRPGKWDRQASDKAGARSAWKGRDSRGADRKPFFSNSERTSQPSGRRPAKRQETGQDSGRAEQRRPFSNSERAPEAGKKRAGSIQVPGRDFPGSPATGPRRWGGLSRADRRPFSKNSERNSKAGEKRPPRTQVSGHDFSRAERKPFLKNSERNSKAGEKRPPRTHVSGHDFSRAERKPFLKNSERNSKAGEKRPPRTQVSGHDFSRAERKPFLKNSERASAREEREQGKRPAQFHSGPRAHRPSGGARPDGGRRRPPNRDEGRDFAARPRSGEGRSDWRARGERSSRKPSEARPAVSRPAPTQRRPGAGPSSFASRGQRQGRPPAGDRARFAPDRGPSRFPGKNARGPAAGNDKRRSAGAGGRARVRKQSGPPRRDRD